MLTAGRKQRVLGAIVSVTCALAAAPWAHAQGADEAAEAPAAQAATPEGEPTAPPPRAAAYGEALATELFTAARELMVSGRYAEACPKLEESARLDARVGTFGKLAECQERLGRLVSARASWQKAVNLARAQGDERLRQAEIELGRVDATVPKIRLVRAAPLPHDAKIRIDGVALSTHSLDMPIPLDPGRHDVAVTASGKQPWSATIELAAGAALATLTVPPLQDAARPVAPAPVAAAPGRTGSALRTAAVVVGGVGVLGLGVGAYFGFTAQSRLDVSNVLGCIDNRCQGRAAEERNAARDAGDLSTAFFVAGGALAAGGITLYIIGHTHDAPSPLSVGASAGPASGRFTVEGMF